MVGPWRQPYGSALGFGNHFSFQNGPVVSGTAGNISGSTTPDVTIGELFVAANTGAVTITYFNMQGYAYKAADYSGKKITVMVVDNGSTSFANSGQLFLLGTDNLSTAGSNQPAFYEFVQFNSAWYQYSQARINRSSINNVTLSSAGSVNVDGVSLIVATGTAANSVIRSFSGGQVGQTVIVTALGTSGVGVFVDGLGNIAMAGTAMYAINVSGSYQFTKVSATLWKMLHIGTTGIANI